MHQTLFQKSNVYFVCRLRAVSAEITIDPTEIADCRWMTVEEFLANDKTQTFHKGIVRAALKGDVLKRGDLPDYEPPAERVELFYSEKVRF